MSKQNATAAKAIRAARAAAENLRRLARTAFEAGIDDPEFPISADRARELAGGVVEAERALCEKYPDVAKDLDAADARVQKERSAKAKAGRAAAEANEKAAKAGKS